jgi:two-component system sensor kinase FixL
VRRALAILVYLALYIALDWISLVAPFGALAITPWNPPAGLTFALYLRHGFRFVPLAFTAVVLADFVLHGLSAAPVATAASALVIAGGYALAAHVLRTRVQLSLRRDRQRDLLWLLGTAIVAPIPIAALVVGIFGLVGLVDRDALFDAAVHFWIGDVLGIVVLTPFLLLIFERRLHAAWSYRRLGEHTLQLLSIALALWLVFGGEPSDHFEVSYALFMPLIWIGLRGGLVAATWGIVVTQLGLIAAIQLKGGYEPDTVAQFQLLLLAVAITGLLLGAVVDGRRGAESLLRDSEAHLKMVVETAPDAILTFSDGGALLSTNPAAEKMFGLGRVTRRETTRQRLLPELDPEASAPLWPREMTAHRLDGSSFLAEVAAGQTGIRSRTIHVAVVRDVTGRKEAEQRLKLRERELAHVARMAATGEMAASLAHELNQPLTALIGFARACQGLLRSDRADPDKVRHAGIGLIDQTVQQALRAGDIIRTTREFLGRGEMRHARLDIPDAVDAVLDLLRAELVHGGVHFTKNFEVPLPPVLADRVQIEQVLVNLIHNSIEATRGARTGTRAIHLRTGPAPADPGFVEIAVADNGPGFPPEIAERLFTRFASTKETGMGLGLSISRSIVEAHGGRIWAASTVEGAEIRFTLPVYAEPPADA